jgi:hypothetical protein
MSITAADIKDRFPEFASVDSTTITRWLEEAERNHCADQWAGKSDDGLSYLTAHLMSLFASQGCEGIEVKGPGPLVSSTEGSVSASWSVPEMFNKDDLGTTKYGRRYLSLLNTLFVTRCT